MFFQIFNEKLLFCFEIDEEDQDYDEEGTKDEEKVKD